MSSTSRKRPARDDEAPSASPAKIRKTETSSPAPDSDDSASDSSVDYSEDDAPANVDGMYLDTVNRSALDFDFEQLCSVSLSNTNVYACLVCGKYFQGRGKQTHAYFHSINDDHHVFINMQTLEVYVLPDNYEVTDRSLNDIKAAIRPTYSPQQVARLDSACSFAHDLNGKKYIPGLVCLNRIKRNDYVNVVVQALAHVAPIRDALLLLPNLEKQTALTRQLAGLVRKIWHPRLFKAHVSPHELMQEIVTRSKNRFRLDHEGDAFEFLAWLLNTLHTDLGGSRKRKSSVVYSTFQGELQVTTTTSSAQTSGPIDGSILETQTSTAKLPFLALSLDLPPKPLFTQDDDGDDEHKGSSSIPQVALVSLLQRYKGMSTVEFHGGSKQYQLLQLPQYIICHVKRFTKSGLAIEKNPTVVNFPIHNVPFGELLPLGVKYETERHATYNLIVNICHDGNPCAQQTQNQKQHGHDDAAAAAIQQANTSVTYSANEIAQVEGQYLVYLYHSADEKWYQMRDLQAEQIMPQMIF
ncbi:U4 U6.U5 tri-snRNP-associated protein, partial [Coemansia sp. Benny D115]